MSKTFTCIDDLHGSAKTKAIHGEDFYQRTGAKGGRKGHTGGFYANRELARQAGRIGKPNTRKRMLQLA